MLLDSGSQCVLQPTRAGGLKITFSNDTGKVVFESVTPYQEARGHIERVFGITSIVAKE
jgi:hypothetical protein